MEDAEPAAHFVYDLSSLKRGVKLLENKLIENEDKRVKHADEPSLFLKSEVELDEAIRIFESLGAHPDLIAAFASLMGLQTLATLLAHRNFDIASAAAQVIAEITDPDVLLEVGDDAGRSLMQGLSSEFDLLALITDNLERSNEGENEDDFKGVYAHLRLISNLSEAGEADGAAQYSEIVQNKRLIDWMLKRVTVVVGTEGLSDENCHYCAELLASVFQAAIEGVAVGDRSNVMDKLLTGLSRFRKAKDLLEDEMECGLNIKDCIVACLLKPEFRDTFGAMEGTQLIIRLLKEDSSHKSLNATRADRNILAIGQVGLEVLSLALLNHPTNCNTFVKAGGLKYLFSTMRRAYAQYEHLAKAKNPWGNSNHLEMVLCTILNLALHTQGTEQSRFIAKFFENDCQKLKFFLNLHLKFFRRTEQIVQEFKTEYADWHLPKDYSQSSSLEGDPPTETPEEEDIYLERCELGLMLLQLVDRILFRLSQLGNAILSIQIHILLNVQVNDEPLLDTLLFCLREYADHCGAAERRTAADQIEQFATEHKQLVELGTNYELEAIEKGKELEKQKELERAEQFREDKLKKRKVEKFREKLRKMDRELEQRENLEQYRYDRKHGNL